MATEVPSLSDLRGLAVKIYSREYVAIRNTKFPSTSDRLKAYQYAKEAQDNANQLLEMEEKSTLPSTPKEETAAEEVWKYVRSSLWSAFNAIRNMKLRAEYVNKIKHEAMENVGKIPNLTAQELEELSKEAVAARNVNMESTRAKQAKNSRCFSEWYKNKGLTYKDLADKYSTKRYNIKKIWCTFN